MASIYYERCRYLRAMFSLARRQFQAEPSAQSVMFGCGDAPAEDALSVFLAALPRVGDKTLIVGVLDAGQPTGWTLVSRAGTRSVEVSKPDLRTSLGTSLAGAAVATTPGLLEGDDWLTFALGVPSVQPI